MNRLVFMVLCLFSFNTIASQLYYPELQVQPKASERIKMEAQKERSAGWKSQLPLIASSALTLAAASMSQAGPVEKTNPDDATLAKNIGMGVGAGWLVASVLLSTSYEPYTGAEQALKSSGQQDPLAKERLAEEHLRSTHDLGVRVMWISAVSQFLTNAHVASKSSKDSSYFAGIAALTAFAPLMFKSSWITSWEYHQEYKKKIYGPIAMPILMNIPSQSLAHNQLSPGLGLFYNF